MNDYEKTVEALSEALRKVFGENVDAQRFVDVTRVPLICQHIATIHEDISAIKKDLNEKFVTQESFNPIQKIVYGIVGLILTSVFVAILATVIK